MPLSENTGLQVFFFFYLLKQIEQSTKKKKIVQINFFLELGLYTFITSYKKIPVTQVQKDRGPPPQRQP